MNGVFKAIGKASGKVFLENADAINSDIINVINRRFNEAYQEVRPIAKNFYGGSRSNICYDTCKNVWEFLKNEIKYKRDSSEAQILRLPKRFLHDRTGDCKSYSLFTAAVLKNIFPEAKVKLRYAGYVRGENIPTHVYCVVNCNGDEIIVDGVYKYFNQEKPYAYKKDYEMKVYTISGHGQPVGGFFQNVGNAIRNVVQKVAEPVKTVALAPMRGAYLSLVLLNFRHWATKLAKVKSANAAALRDKWEKLGGNYSQLVDTIEKGSKKKGLFGINGIGAEPISTAGLLASAATIAAAMAEILKQFGQNPDTPDSSAPTTDLPGSEPDTYIPTGTYNDGSGTTTGFSLSPTTLLIGAAVVGGIILLTNKSK